MKEQHLTYEILASKTGHITLGSVTETPAENRGNHDLVVQARDRRYFVRLVGTNGWSLTEWIQREAVQVVKNHIEAGEPLEM